MKFLVDDEVVYELNDDQIKILQSNISADLFLDDIKRRVKWVIEHKLQVTTEELNNAWRPILAQSNATLPVDAEALAKMALEHPEYKDAKAVSDLQVAKLEATAEVTNA